MATKKDIVLIWAVMSEMYAQKWTSHYGEIDAHNIWIKTLSAVSTDAIKNALEACLIAYPDWPPTLPQFRFLCLGFPTKAEATRLIFKTPNDDDSLTDNFIRAMRYRIGEWNLTNMPLRALGPMINNAYNDVVKVYSGLANNGRLVAPFKRVNHHG